MAILKLTCDCGITRIFKVEEFHPFSKTVPFIPDSYVCIKCFKKPIVEIIEKETEEASNDKTV